MVIIRGLDAMKERYGDAVLTIGNFDGVHIGHQKIFRNVVERSRALGGIPMVITFDPHPLQVLSPEKGVRVLTPFDEKVRLMELHGIGVVLCINFDREFASTMPEDFIRDVIVNKIGGVEVIVGHNYAFGKGKRGTTEFLRRRGKRYGFGVKVIRNAVLFGAVVSSSRIRNLIGSGEVLEASWLLGRPYMIEGYVIRGSGRGGRLLNIPTANISPPENLVPKEGVYAVKVELDDGGVWDGVANIGVKPTFGAGRMSYEVHIFDFSGTLLGRRLRVHFIDRIRGERAFPDIMTLQKNILKDIKRAKEILEGGKYPKLI